MVQFKEKMAEVQARIVKFEAKKSRMSTVNMKCLAKNCRMSTINDQILTRNNQISTKIAKFQETISETSNPNSQISRYKYLVLS